MGGYQSPPVAAPTITTFPAAQPLPSVLTHPASTVSAPNVVANIQADIEEERANDPTNTKNFGGATAIDATGTVRTSPVFKGYSDTRGSKSPEATHSEGQTMGYLRNLHDKLGFQAQKIAIYTELYPCELCQSALRNFIQEFSDTEVRIFSQGKYPNRGGPWLPFNLP